MRARAALTVGQPSGSPCAATLHAPGRSAALAAARPRRWRCRAAVGEAPRAGAAAAAPADAARADARRLELSLETYQYSKCPEPELLLDPVASLRVQLDSVSRELGSVTEAEYARLASRAAAPPSPAVHLPAAAVEQLVQEIRQQHSPAPAPPPAPVAHHAPPAPPAPAPPAPAPEAEPQLQQNQILPINLKPLDDRAIKPEGTGEEVLLQGFNWDSWKLAGGWFNHVGSRAEEIAGLGFTTIWLPPFTQSVSAEGYLPGDLYNLNSKYGSEAELIGCVRALQERGVKVLGDAVLNHRCAQHQDESGTWNKYGGRLAWDQRAIVGDDPNFRGRGHRSSGDIFPAAPNIDHSQDFVKRDLQEWMVWLRTHVGFDGWRLDFVKGFHGSHVKDYMEASAPQFAVGEYWDTLAYEWDGTPTHNQDAHRQRTVNWINAAGGLATAFDITLKGIMHAVFERCEYWRLKDSTGKPAGLLGWWPSRAVTFLENHDTGSSQGHWRFPNHAVEQGYCYLLTHPGTPCVFWDHLQDRHLRDTIARLIALRKGAGVHCRSPVKILAAERDVYAAEVEGSRGKLLMKIGPGDFTPPAAGGWDIADCGHNWGVWERKA